MISIIYHDGATVFPCPPDKPQALRTRPEMGKSTFIPC